MTYCLNKKSPISHEESRLLQLLNKALPCITRPVVLKWSVTQVRSVPRAADLACQPGGAHGPVVLKWPVTQVGFEWCPVGSGGRFLSQLRRQD